MADTPDIALLTPYARSLGISLDRWDGEAPVLRVDFSEAVLGRPGALHGGAISGLLETAGYGVLRAALARSGREAGFVPINITVKLGRRTANLSVEAWQDDPLKPIASAVMNVMIRDAD